MHFRPSKRLRRTLRTPDEVLGLARAVVAALPEDELARTLQA